MLESTTKGIIYALNSFTVVDKKSGEEKGLIDVYYLYPMKSDKATRVGYNSSHHYVSFSDNVWVELNKLILKSCDFHFNLVEDYKDANIYNKKLVAINDIVIKQ